MKKKHESNKKVSASTILDTHQFKKKCRILSILLTIIVFVFYFPSLRCNFVSWDDEGYILNNLRNIGDFSFTGILKIFGTKAIMGNYHPLTITVYAFIYHFFKFSPFAFHLFNLLIHIINTILVFYLILRFVVNSNSEKILGFEKVLIVPFVTAILFGIHPLHVESVTWISETKDVLYTFFFLSGLMMYMKYIIKSDKKNYFFCLILFFLSCLSKGQAVTFSLVIILIDYFQDRNVLKNIFPEKIPFIVISVIFGLLAIKAQTASEAVQSLSQFSIIDRIIFPFYALAFYIQKMIIPINLSIIYPYPATSLPIEYYISAIIVILLAVFVFLKAKNNKLIVFGLLFFLLVILPVLQIKPVGESITADRYFYIPSIGLFFIVGYAIEKIIMNHTIKLQTKKVIITGLLIVFCIYGILSFQRTKVWTNSQTLWQSVLNVYPDNDKAYYGIGVYLERKGNKSEALNYYKKAIEKNPQNFKAINNIGNFYYLDKSLDSAFFYYSKSVRINPKFAEGYYNMANIEYAKGNIDKALDLYKNSTEIEYYFANALYMQAICYIAKKDTLNATENLKKAAEYGSVQAKKMLKSTK